MTNSDHAKTVSRRFVVLNYFGLHSRASMNVVDVANQFASELCIEFDDKKYDCKSVMSVISATMVQGDEFTIHAYGNDCVEALEAINGVLHYLCEREGG